jgi:23S rRNA (uridine2552-2'-O)-methyltransferase
LPLRKTDSCELRAKGVKTIKDSGGAGGRELKTRVKTARKRTLSSTLWLQRQLNDPYVARAKREGWRSRAAFKLLEIDEKYRLLHPGQRIVDLGAAPGGWSQAAAKKVKSVGGQGKVVGIDLLDIEPIAGVDFAVQDFLEPEAPEILKTMLGGEADGVLSDMAANTTGHKKTDHLRIIHLAELAADFSSEVLKSGGFFLCKLFQGGETGELVARLKRDYALVRHIKPNASRADSAELYVLATGFRASSK